MGLKDKDKTAILQTKRVAPLRLSLTHTHSDDGVSALFMGALRKGGVVMAANDTHQAMYMPAQDYHTQAVARRTIQSLLGAS